MWKTKSNYRGVAIIIDIKKLAENLGWLQSRIIRKIKNTFKKRRRVYKGYKRHIKFIKENNWITT
jgi:hypothetical protein